MLDLPSTKQVSRSLALDISSPSHAASESESKTPTSSSEPQSPPPTAQDAANLRVLGAILGYSENETENEDVQDEEVQHDDIASDHRPDSHHVPGHGKEGAEKDNDDQTFSFPLFARTSTLRGDGGRVEDDDSAARGLIRVNIRSPTPVSGWGGGGGFVVKPRAGGYYFTDADGDEGKRKRGEYEEVALAGEEVRMLAGRIGWPGTALPWRVIRVPASSLNLSLRGPARTATATATPPLPASIAATSQESRLKTQGRAGKKRRIALRKKHAVQARAAETEKEKRSRRNREKKLKKRERNRRIKQEEIIEGEKKAAQVDVS